MKVTVAFAPSKCLIQIQGALYRYAVMKVNPFWDMFDISKDVAIQILDTQD